MEKKELNVLLAEINAKCWDDEVFKARFIAEPQSVFEEYKIPYNPDMEYRVLESSKDEAILVLPVKGAQEVLSKVAESAQKVPDSTPIFPNGRKMVIVQNTDKLTYLVISNVEEISAGADISGMPTVPTSWTKIFTNIVVSTNAVVVTDAVAAAQVTIGAEAAVAMLTVASVVAV